MCAIRVVYECAVQCALARMEPAAGNIWHLALLSVCPGRTFSDASVPRTRAVVSVHSSQQQERHHKHSHSQLRRSAQAITMPPVVLLSAYSVSPYADRTATVLVVPTASGLSRVLSVEIVLLRTVLPGVSRLSAFAVAYI